MRQSLTKDRFILIIALLAAAVVCANADASPFIFSSSSGTRAASALFQTNGMDLIITLQNTSSYDALTPPDILTGVFFDVAGVPLTLTRVSAIVPASSSVCFGATEPGGVVGGEWAYRAALSGPRGAAYGISSAGLGLFGQADVFPGSNLQGPASPDGLQYGITSAADDPATGNQAVTGSNALIKSSVMFTLSGLPAGFSPLQAISNVNFQYGTSLSEPNLNPEPATLALLGLAGFAGLRRRR